jgi:hypothetical protein
MSPAISMGKPFISAGKDVINIMVKQTLAFLFLLSFTLPILGQQPGPGLEKELTISASSIRLDSLLRLIEDRTGAKFSLNPRKLPLSTFIRLKKGPQSVATLLSTISAATGVSYKVLGAHIILVHDPHSPLIAPLPASPDPRSPNAAPTRNHRQPATTLSHKPPPHPMTILRHATVLFRPVIITDGPSPLSGYFPGPRSPFRSVSVPPIIRSPGSGSPLHPAPSTDTISAHDQKNAGNKKIKKVRVGPDLFLKAGLTADDLCYASPTIETGIKPFYGIFSWNTDFKIAEFRYGLGWSTELDDDWQLQIMATTGRADEVYDTTGYQTLVKKDWQKLGVLGEKTIGRHFKLQVGLTVNWLRSTYYLNNKPSPPTLSASDADKKYDFLKPLYTIKDTYSSQSAKRDQYWIGLQVGILYEIDFFKRR